MDEFIGYVEEPASPDENDPEFQAELFDTFFALGWKPEDIKVPELASRYAEWLNTQDAGDEALPESRPGSGRPRGSRRKP